MNGMAPKPIIRNNVTPQALAKLKRAIEFSNRVLVLTGAGISTDSGIPDFRGPRGVWTMNPDAERDSNINAYIGDKNVRIRSWQGKGLFGMMGQPNDGHMALVKLEQDGKLHKIVTQNVDGLHQKAGVPDEKVIEFHGNLRTASCISCEKQVPMDEIYGRIGKGDVDPHCECGWPFKADVVLFGEMIPEKASVEASEAVATCDMVLILGTSLKVPPFNNLPQMAANIGTPIWSINNQSTQWDKLFTDALRGSISEILPQVV